MESVIRALVVYAFLLLVFRLGGKRTLTETTNFELVLLLIISETTQQAMVDDDHSVTNALLLITTLVGASVVLSYVKQRWPHVDKWLDGVPCVVVRDGTLLREPMARLRVDESDILEAARTLRGLERLDQVKYATVERGGDISIVPR